MLVDDERGIHVPPHRRGIGYVPQHHALFPFVDVAGNVGFGLPRRARTPARIRALLEDVGGAHLADADPARLSGGERQRVALARALAVEPRLLLLDEPFASLDAGARGALQRTLRGVLERRGVPAVLVTHDVDEALAVGDHVVRLERGRVVASGPPAAVLPGRPIELRGTVTARRTLDDGRVEATLADARVVGPAEVVAADEITIDARPVTK